MTYDEALLVKHDVRHTAGWRYLRTTCSWLGSQWRVWAKDLSTGEVYIFPTATSWFREVQAA